MKRIARVLGIALVLLIVVAISLPFLVNANQFRPMLEAKLSQGLGREVKLGDLKFSILSGGVTASDLSIADHPAFSKSPFVRAKSLTVSAELWPFVVSRKLNVTGITIDQPEIVLLQSAPGQWNFAPASVMPFDLSAKVAGGGDINLSGKAGPVHTEGVMQTPIEASLKVTHLDLIASGLMEASSGMGGFLSVDGSGSSNGSNLELKGRVKADQLKLARGGSPARRPVEFDFTVDHDLRRGAGALRRGDVHIGAAVASLTGTYAEHGESTTLNANLSGHGMPIPELEAMLPALNIELPQGSSLHGGTANVKVAVGGTFDRLTAKGFLSLDHTRL